MQKRIDQVLSGDQIVTYRDDDTYFWDRVHGVSELNEDGLVLVTTDSARNWMTPDTVVDVV